MVETIATLLLTNGERRLRRRTRTDYTRPWCHLKCSWTLALPVLSPGHFIQFHTSGHSNWSLQWRHVRFCWGNEKPHEGKSAGNIITNCNSTNEQPAAPGKSVFSYSYATSPDTLPDECIRPRLYIIKKDSLLVIVPLQRFLPIAGGQPPHKWVIIRSSRTIVTFSRVDVERGHNLNRWWKGLQKHWTILVIILFLCTRDNRWSKRRCENCDEK